MKIEDLTQEEIQNLVNNFCNKDELINWCINNGFTYRKSASFKRLKEDLLLDLERTGQFIRIANGNKKG